MPLPSIDETSHFPGLARVAALLADPGRAAMLWALMDGSARPAGELTMIAGLSPSAASAHLARLAEGGLLKPEVRGRHRYYRIATSEVAAAIEALMNVAHAAAPAQPVTRAARTVPVEMRHARTCYDHMAGEVAVRVFDRLVEGGWLVRNDDDLEVTEQGVARLSNLGVDLGALHARRRRFACTCLDWSERRPHLGGALGAALLERFTSNGWVERASRPRVLRITPLGQHEFETFVTT